MASGPASETLYLVDAYSLIFQVFHAIPAMTSPAGLPTNALFGFTKDMLFLRDRRPGYLVCLFDAGPTFREKVYTEYKAHRAPMPDDLSLQIPLIQEMLHAMRIPGLAHEGFEADDLIATLAVAGAERGMEVFICSSDKDCRQLLSDRVKIFNLRKQEIFDATALMRDWGVKPEQVIDYQTLVGDSVDNVPGVTGVGAKTASKYLQEYGSLDNLIEHIDELPGKKKENFQAALPHLPTSRHLVTLDTKVPVELTWDSWRLQEWDSTRLLELFRSWGFHRFADQVRSAKPLRPPTTIQQGALFDTGEQAQQDGADTSGPRPVAWRHTYHLVNHPAAFDDFVKRLEQQPRFAVDVVTTSSDPRQAALVGLAFSWREGEAWYLPVRGPAGEALLDEEETLERVRPILEDPNRAKISQNIKYDWQVFHALGIRLGGMASDSMVADYLLHAGERSHSLEVLAEKHLNHRPIALGDLLGKGKQQRSIDQVPSAQVAEYAGERVDIVWRLCSLLEPMLAERNWKRSTASSGTCFECLYDDLEMPLVEVLAEMEATGVRLDVELLAGMSREMNENLVRIEKRIYELAGREFNIGSVKQLREVLFQDHGFRPEKKTAITRSASTDQETLEGLAAQGHELPQQLLDHRKIAKLKSTYVDALPALVNARTGRIHASFNQTVAATGRLSSSDPNLQNIPIRSEQGGQIRQAFLPEEGWLLLAADYSQIELRLLAHFSGDEQLRQAFADDRDIHALVAAQIFGVEPSDVTAEMRRTAKTVNFGVIYGISAFGLAQRLQLTKEDAARFIDAYFARYPRVLSYQEKLLEECRRSGYVATILGRRRAIEGIRSRTRYQQRNQPEREAINMQIQGSAADLIKVAMLNIHRRLRRERLEARLLLQIHDELVFEMPPGERDEVIRLVRDEMTGALADRLTVPLGVDLGVGPNWLDTAEPETAPVEAGA